jgi:hypothetical protein
MSATTAARIMTKTRLVTSVPPASDRTLGQIGKAGITPP